MTKHYRPWSPFQPFLLPPSPHDWLAEDHLAYFILDVMDQLDLRAIDARYQAKDPRGTRPYSPQMMTALLLYGYCVGLTSSRRLERATYEDIAVRVIAGENHPDHSRISEFRRAHLAELSALFVDVLRLCQCAGLVKLGHVALDGTKVKANASKHKAMSHERLLKGEAELEAEVERLLGEAEQVDQREDARYGKGLHGDELPEELRRRKGRLAKIRDARRQLEAEASATRARELAEQERDAEQRANQEPVGEKRNRIAGRGKLAQRKGRAARKKAREKAREADNPDPDLEARDPDDLPTHQVPCDKAGNPQPKAQRNFTDPDSCIMKRDGAFLQGYNGQAIADGESQVIVAAALTNQPPDAEHLRPMLAQVKENCGALPKKLSADAGYWSEENAEHCAGAGVDAYIATGRLKHGEELPPVRGRIPKSLDAKGLMRRKLLTQKGRSVYRLRKAIIEPVFGQIKPRLPFGFQLRGMEKVSGEWLLHCTAHNLLKLFRSRMAAV